jgi:DNA-binding LytR/AlgR family response regulator
MVKSFSLHLKSSAIIEKERKSTLFELENGTNLKVYIDEIIFVETNFRTCVLNTVRGLYMLKKMTLKKVLELTNQEFILQTHRSYLVNVKFISNIEKLDKRISQIHFDKYEGMALLSYTYRNNVLERLK